jgi:hypothetical protein
MRLSQRYQFREHKRCGRLRHHPGEPFQDRRGLAAPCARCECGQIVLFLLDGLSAELGPAIMPSDAIASELFEDDNCGEEHDDRPVLDTGTDEAEAWLRTASEQRAFLAAILYAQDRLIQRVAWLVNSVVIALTVVGIVVTLLFVGMPSWPRFMSAIPWLVAGGLLDLFRHVRRGRRVSTAMRRYGVDDTLLQDVCRMFQWRRPRRPR